MKKLLLISLIAVVAFLAGRLSNQAPVIAEGGGAGAKDFPPCADLNSDQRFDISDAVFLLQYLFLDGPRPECPSETTNCPQCVVDTGRFIDNGDGTATDPCTGLMWQKEVIDYNGDGVIDSNTDRAVYDEAENFIENQVFAGYDDWRVPTRWEFFTILGGPVIHIRSSWHWTWTPSEFTYAFKSGNKDDMGYLQGNMYRCFALAVRTIQPGE